MIQAVSENLTRNSCLSVSKEGDFLRVVWSKSVPLKGFEKAESKKDKKEKTESNGRFDESISRTRSTVRQYARCNEWDYFVTITISPDKFDRFDLSGFYKVFSKYIANINQRRDDGEKLLYMFIPEQHDNGAWHFHGLVKGIPKGMLERLEIGMKMSKKQAERVYAGDKIYVSKPIEKRFGYNEFDPIKSHEAVSLYITKYVTKDALKTELPKGYRFVLCSCGLKKAKLLRRFYGATMNALPNGVNYNWVSEDGNTAILTIKPTKDIEDKFLNDLDILFQREENKDVSTVHGM